MFYRSLMVFICYSNLTVVHAYESIWISVDTSAQALVVMRGSKVVETYHNISIGRSGVVTGGMRKSGDDRTPLGKFRIAWINKGSQFYRFYGLNYPTKPHAWRAYVEGLIDEATYDRIHSAIRKGRLPPQDTPMGGYVGIHGLGKGDRHIHQALNWTHGCVALTNRQIDKLSRWLHKGTKVVIH